METLTQCQNCGLDIEFGDPHGDIPEGVWFHTEHGSITCGAPAPDAVAQP